MKFFLVISLALVSMTIGKNTKRQDGMKGFDNFFEIQKLFQKISEDPKQMRSKIEFLAAKCNKGKSGDRENVEKVQKIFLEAARCSMESASPLVGEYIGAIFQNDFKNVSKAMCEQWDVLRPKCLEKAFEYLRNCNHDANMFVQVTDNVKKFVCNEDPIENHLSQMLSDNGLFCLVSIREQLQSCFVTAFATKDICVGLESLPNCIKTKVPKGKCQKPLKVGLALLDQLEYDLKCKKAPGQNDAPKKMENSIAKLFFAFFGYK